MRNRNWTLALVAALGLAACGDMLTEVPEGFLTPDNFYRTAADADAAATAAYAPLLGGDGLGTALYWALELPSDISRVGAAEENPNIVSLGAMNWDSNNPSIANAWRALYTTVTRANIVLERVPATPMPDAAKAPILAEAKFLRALSYAYLVRLWGDVPLVRTTEEQLANPGRSPQEEVFQLVLQDARDAASTLPEGRTGSSLGRATRGAALALLADVHLWRKEWQPAADATQQIIESGVYSLDANYLRNFLPGAQNRGEEVFALQYSAAAGAPGSSLASWTYPRELGPSQLGGWATIEPVMWHYQSYAPGDYRWDVTYRTQGVDVTGTVQTFYPSIFKFRPTARPGPQDMNTPIYRYADVLLMHAEALNELGRSTEAVEHVNQVRARARRGTGNETRPQPADLPVMSQAELREAVFEERRFELAHEAKRWFDLVRRGPEFFTAQLAKNPHATDVQPTDMLWPVPQREIDLNPALRQNAGY